MKKIAYILTGMCLLLFPACEIEDKGHYDYTPLNELTIEGIESAYHLLAQVDDLNIEPKITASVPTDEANYEYSWFFCSGSDHQHTQISTEKDLHWSVTLNPGNYTLYFQVKDKSSELQWIESTDITITTDYTTGFLLLGDEPGSDRLRMDMIMTRIGTDTLVGERVFVPETNLINAERLLFSGSGGSIMGMDMDTNKDLYVLTENQDVKITSGTYFKELGDFNTLGIIETEMTHAEPIRVKDVFPHPTYGSNPSTTYRGRSIRGYITEDMIFAASIIQAEYFSTPINKYSENSTQLFRPYPLAFGQGACAYNKFYPIFYDMDAQRFVTIDRKSTASLYSAPSFGTIGCCQEMDDHEGEPFPWDQTSVGRSLVYGENGYKNGGDSYALMVDQEGNYCIYVFRTAASGTWLSFTHSKRGCYPIEATAQNFDQASHYAFLSDKYVILYSVGSMLYAYDYTRQQLASMDMGAEITCLETEYLSAGSLTDIILATFDEGTGTGTVRKLTIGGGNNNVTIEEKPKEIWPVTMRVKDILWKNSGDNTLETDLLAESNDETE